MNCRKAQELIISGYSDNELKFYWKKELESHLGSCAHCREFLSVFKNSVVEPFRKAESIDAPDYLWHRIKGQIQASKPAPNRNYIWDLFIRMPKPVFAAIAVILLITINLLAVGVINFNHNDKGSTAVIAYLEDSSANADDPIDFGADIEKAFL